MMLQPHASKRKWPGAWLAAVLLAAAGAAEIRVQDIAALQGRHANRIQGYGLVIGLDGSGDGEASPATLRALAQMHGRFQQPILDIEELAANKSVAIVVVEAELPDHGVRTGMRVDVTVSAVGTAESLAGGQLVVTPLQEATLSMPNILALAGGEIRIPPNGNKTRGIVRGGAVIEEDIFHNFVEDGHVTLVLHDAKVGYAWAQILARSVDAELQTFAQRGGEPANGRRVVAGSQSAVAIGPNSVRVRVPEYYLNDPAPFISRVLAAEIFQEPPQASRVVINTATNDISFTGNVSISPTVLVVPGVGTVAVGGGGGGGGGGAAGVQGITTRKPDEAETVEFQALLSQLAQLQLTNEQMVSVVEQLHRTGTLHAELIYTE